MNFATANMTWHLSLEINRGFFTLSMTWVWSL